MQSFFHWDNPFPLPKRPKLTDMDLSLNLPNQSQVVIREIEGNEAGSNVKNYPHQWFKGESSNTTDENQDGNPQGVLQ